MVDIVNVKLKNGSDLVGVLSKQEDKFVIMENPVEIHADPQYGFYAKSWLLLSEESLVTLDRSDIFYVQTANDKAISYYEEFLDKVSSDRKSMSDDEFTHELEEVFTAMLESRSTIKH